MIDVFAFWSKIGPKTKLGKLPFAFLGRPFLHKKQHPGRNLMLDDIWGPFARFVSVCQFRGFFLLRRFRRFQKQTSPQSEFADFPWVRLSRPAHTMIYFGTPSALNFFISSQIENPYI